MECHVKKYVLMLFAVGLCAVPAFADEPLASKEHECQAALEFNRQDFMRMRDQFVKIAILAETLKAKLEQAEKALAKATTPVPEP